ncbi:MAG: histone deacetylase family protein [Gammaproteobacteria bacterium]|nr:MAG: histone deacetylase family protein [Gammaproteobacteria bacterium]
MTTALFHHQDCEKHNMGPEHPESPLRIAAILNQLQDNALLDELVVIRPDEIQRELIAQVHPDSHITQLEMLAPPKGRVFVDPDTAVMPDTLRAAFLAAGAAVEATDAILSGEFDTAFCATRPPGHHAERNRAMGFCFFNNIAIAAQRALNYHALERIAIIDFDVHQGNGTVDIFKNDPRVLVCSSFQHPHYPNSHYVMEQEHIVNTPLDAGTDGRGFRRAVERDWLHRLQDHKPQMIFISAGFDAHELDPLGDLRLRGEDYRWVTRLIMDVAKSTARGRVLSILEGGYNLKALAEGVDQHLQVLAGH